MTLAENYWGLRLDLRGSTPLDPSEEELVTWWTIDLLGDDPTGDDGEGDMIKLGSAELFTLDGGRCEAAGLTTWDVLDADAHTADYRALAPSDSGWFADNQTDLIVLHRVEVVPEHRGHRFGRLLAAAGLRELGGGRFGSMNASLPLSQLDKSDPGRPADQARLDALVEAVGLSRWREGLWTCAGETLDLDQTVAGLLHDGRPGPER